MSPGDQATTRDGAPLANRHAVVTGGGRGIGAAVAAELARLGADITIMGRDAETLRRRREALSGECGGQVFDVVVDVTDGAAVARAFEWADNMLGPVEILVNNAGAAASAPFARTDPELWRSMIEVNLTGPFLCCRAALPSMIERGWGRIVNIASTAGVTGYAYVSAYCAAKHGVVGLTRALARELARKGVTVNAVCPGYTDTDMAEAAVRNIVETTGRDEAAARAELVRSNPQGRLVDPAEVARTVGWLALPGTDAVTGQAVVVAGGEVMP